MEKETEDKLKEEFSKGFKKAHVRGLSDGMKTVCSVISGICDNQKLTEQAKILEIKKFCDLSLDKFKKEKT